MFKIFTFSLKNDSRSISNNLKMTPESFWSNFHIIFTLWDPQTTNFQSKLIINDECANQKKKLFIGSVSQFDAHIFFFNFSENGSCLRCFMPKAPKISPRCQDEGIIGTVTGTAGTIIANELIKDTAGIKSNLLNETLIMNFENLLFRKVKIKKSIKCKNHG